MDVEEDSEDEDEDKGDDDSEEEVEEDGLTEDDTELDSDIEEVEKIQDTLKAKLVLGRDSNALVWPRGPILDDDEEDAEGPDNFTNQRLVRLADNCSDLADSDSDNDSDASTDSNSDSDEIPIEAGGASLLLSQPQTEFKREVKLSLDRAFEEGHSVDNAAVELKTLRMASNVPLVHVRTGVVAAIVDRIPIVEGNPGEQRQAIGKMIGRWGELINRIGGIDGVETVTVLQAQCASSKRVALFGPILVALYQQDIVDEDDIRGWHELPVSQGVGALLSEAEELKRCWTVGSRMIEQFDEQESSEEDDDEDSE